MTINMTLRPNILKGDFERVKARFTDNIFRQGRIPITDITIKKRMLKIIISTKGLRPQLKIMVTTSS